MWISIQVGKSRVCFTYLLSLTYDAHVSLFYTYLFTHDGKKSAFLLTYVLSAKDRHMIVKMYFLLTYLHTCRSIKFMLFHTSHLFPSPTQVNKVRPSLHMTQQTRCRRCPSNQMPTYDRWLLAKKHPFSYKLTYVLCINDRYKSVKIVYSYLFTHILMLVG